MKCALSAYSQRLFTLNNSAHSESPWVMAATSPVPAVTECEYPHRPLTPRFFKYAYTSAFPFLF